MAGKIVSAVLAAAAGAAAGFAAWLVPSYGIPAAERERRRRLSVNARGRVVAAMITEVQDSLISYRYSIGGVEYSATQDIAALKDLLTDDPAMLIERPTAIKYLSANPANSIVICEEWSGLEFPRGE